MHNRQLKRTDPISLSSLFSYRCAILFRLSAETNEKKNLFRGMTNVRTNERTKPRLIYERSFDRNVLTIGQKQRGVTSVRMNFVWIDFSIRFNTLFNTCTRQKIIARIIGIAVIKTRHELGYD